VCSAVEAERDVLQAPPPEALYESEQGAGISITTSSSSSETADAASEAPWVQPNPELIERLRGQLILGPLTKFGNLPFRRLAVSLGAEVTMGEMMFSKTLVKGRDRIEQARLRQAPNETCFGAQMATKTIAEGIASAKVAADAGATWIDLNCGCPIYEATRRGLGARLLEKPAKLHRLVEGIAAGSPIPLTVKIRIGPKDVNVDKVVPGLQCAGATAVSIHGRTQQQRYTKAADWDCISSIASAHKVPIIGNGDVLAFFEAKQRMLENGCLAVMAARGALIKPWLFHEWKEQQEWMPTAQERVSIYRQLVSYQKDHFGDDDMGRKKAFAFLPGHLHWFARYRPHPEALFAAASAQQPLLTTRQGVVDEVRGEDLDSIGMLERLLRCTADEAHQHMAALLWDSTSDTEAAEQLTRLAESEVIRWEEELASADSRDSRDSRDADVQG